jgi:hypothetical protein
MTGMTARQCKKMDNYLFDMFDIFKRYGEALGHTMDWRKVELGEDLSQYDMAIVAVGPIHSLSARLHGLQTMYVMSQLPCSIYFDDWQVYATVTGFRYIDKKFDYFINKKVGGQNFFVKSAEEFKKHEEQIRDVAQKFTAGDHRGHKLVFPLFNWGNIENVLKLIPIKHETKILQFDPSPELLHQGYAFEKPITTEKSRSWFLPTLLDHSAWTKKQNLSWPVEWIGNKKKTGIKVNEREVFNLAERHWGYLSPSYHHDGCGWYRTRFIYSALNDCILLTGKKDQMVLGNAYQISSNIENLSEESLKEIAIYQRNTLMSYVKDTEFLKEQVCSILSL